MNDDPIKSLRELGWNSFFQEHFESMKVPRSVPGRVVSESKGSYQVYGQYGELTAKISGKMRYRSAAENQYPAVGDWVTISQTEKEQAIIHGILPRRTVIKRKYSGKNETQIIATNIDVAFVVESVDKDYSLNRFERYFSLLAEEGIKPVIILNKIDLISKEDLGIKLNEIKNRFSDIDFIPASIITSRGLDKLKNYIIERC